MPEEQIPTVAIDDKESEQLKEPILEVKVKAQVEKSEQTKEKIDGCFIYDSLDQFENMVDEIARAEAEERIKLKKELYEFIGKSDPLSEKEGKDGNILFGSTESEHVIMTKDKDSKLLSFDPKNNFSGTITVDRVDEKGKLLEDSKDVIFYRNGEVIGFVEGDKGTTRLKDIPQLREKGLNIPEPLIDASKSIDNSVKQKLNNNVYEDLEGLNELFKENISTLSQLASRTADQTNEQHLAQKVVESLQNSTVPHNAISEIPVPAANQVNKNELTTDQQYIRQQTLEGPSNSTIIHNAELSDESSLIGRSENLQNTKIVGTASVVNPSAVTHQANMIAGVNNQQKIASRQANILVGQGELSNIEVKQQKEINDPIHASREEESTKKPFDSGKILSAVQKLGNEVDGLSKAIINSQKGQHQTEEQITDKKGKNSEFKESTAILNAGKALAEAGAKFIESLNSGKSVSPVSTPEPGQQSIGAKGNVKS